MRKIDIVGAGSLGSFTALILGKMAPTFGWKFTYLDHDKVVAHNLINQLYRKKDVERLKVEALAEIMAEFAGIKAETDAVRVGRDSVLHQTVITLVDTMSARKEIFDASAFSADIDLYIEARSGGIGAQVYALDPRDPDLVRRYRETLFEDEEGLPAPCADHATVPTLLMVASAIGRILVRHDLQRVPHAEMLVVNIDMQNLPSMRSSRYIE
jgi:molybdopterin/thiamine biosynthesis adenylyltransferase